MNKTLYKYFLPIASVPGKTSSSKSEHLTHPKYRPDIDGLRAIAVLSVVGFHAFGIRGGFIGVDVFFVISGFLISTIIFENMEKDSFSFIEFYGRRIRRIFPSLLLVLMVCLLFGWFVLFADEYQQLGKHIAAGAGFVSNLALWSESGYFDIVAEKKPLLHLWSLGIEEQFYLIWPLLVWAFWKLRINFLLVLLAIITISFGLNIWQVNKDIVATFYSPQTRFWELLTGACVAYVMLFKQSLLKIFKEKATLFSSIGFTLIAAGIILLTKDKAFPGWWALLPCLGTALIISAGPQTWLSRKILSNSLLVWFGLISYPLYLWHWPILSFTRIIGDPSRAVVNGAVIISILLAWMSFKFIEKPIRYGKNRGIKSIGLLVLLLVVGLFAFGTYKVGGFEFRIKDGHGGQEVKKYRSQLEWPETNNKTDDCINQYGGDQYCLITDINKPPTAAIIGDSHANHFYFGLNDYLKKTGGNLLLLGAGGCPPFLGVDRGKHPFFGNLNCFQRTNSLYQFVLNDSNIKTVFISFAHGEIMRNDVEFLDKWGEIKAEDNYDNLVKAFIRTVQIFEKHNKQVVLIYDMPEFNIDVKSCAFKRPLFSNSNESKCNFADASMVNDFQDYDKMITEIKKSTNIKIFYTHQYIRGNFPVDEKLNLTYRDSTHLSYLGSMFFSDKYSF